jgi:hypothetical protein
MLLVERVGLSTISNLGDRGKVDEGKAVQLKIAKRVKFNFSFRVSD